MEALEINIVIVIPILLLSPTEGIYSIRLETINQISSLSYFIDFPYRGKSEVKPKKLSKSQENKICKLFFDFHSIELFKLVAFEVTIDYESYKVNFDSNMSEESKYNLFFFDIRSEIEFNLYGLALAANIARPGTFSFGKTVILVDGNTYCGSVTGLSNDLDNIHIERKANYPELDFFDILEVWNWLKSFEDFNTAFGKTPLGRGLAAFSYLFFHNFNESEPLKLWAIVGLESLYKSNGSKRELVTKIQLFLGNHPRLKSLVDEIYGIRSSLVHGGMNFPFMFCPYDDMRVPDYGKYTDKSINVEDTTVALLIATLQKMYSLNLFDIEFEYRLKSNLRREN